MWGSPGRGTVQEMHHQHHFFPRYSPRKTPAFDNFVPRTLAQRLTNHVNYGSRPSAGAASEDGALVRQQSDFSTTQTPLLNDKARMDAERPQGYNDDMLSIFSLPAVEIQFKLDAGDLRIPRTDIFKTSVPVSSTCGTAIALVGFR